jgi:hypothetical protein
MKQITLHRDTRAFLRMGGVSKLLCWSDLVLEKGTTLVVSNPVIMVYDHRDQLAVSFQSDQGQECFLLVDDISEMVAVEVDDLDRLPITGGSHDWSQEMILAVTVFGESLAFTVEVESTQLIDSAGTKRRFSGRQVVTVIGVSDQGPTRGSCFRGEYDTATQSGWVVIEDIDA